MDEDNEPLIDKDVLNGNSPHKIKKAKICNCLYYLFKLLIFGFLVILGFSSIGYNIYISTITNRNIILMSNNFNSSFAYLIKTLNLTK